MDLKMNVYEHFSLDKEEGNNSLTLSKHLLEIGGENLKHWMGKD